MAGKGDMARPCDRRKYEAGYNEIDWSVGKKKPVGKKKEDSNVFPIVPLPQQSESYYCHLDMGKGPSKSASQMFQIPSSLLFNKN